MALHLYNIRRFKSRYRTRSIPCILFWAGVAVVMLGWWEVSCACQTRPHLSIVAPSDSSATLRPWLVWVLITHFAHYFLNQPITVYCIGLSCWAGRAQVLSWQGKCANTNPCHIEQQQRLWPGQTLLSRLSLQLCPGCAGRAVLLQSRVCHAAPLLL